MQLDITNLVTFWCHSPATDVSFKFSFLAHFIASCDMCDYGPKTIEYVKEK